MNNALLGYQEKNTPIHNFNAIAKLLYFLLTSLVLMLTYDSRLIALITVTSLLAIKLAKVEWKSISFVVNVIVAFSLLNLIAVYLFAPEYGVELYGTRTVIWEGVDRYTLTWEQVYYQFNLLLKYFATVPLVIVFLVTINPSEFASSFNRIGMPYRIAYAISLTLRYIPDVQRDYLNIWNAQSARGIVIGDKEKLSQKFQKAVKIIFPLILTSFNRIETISHAMMLRRFGQGTKRTWYVEKKLEIKDYLLVALALVWIALLIFLWQANGGRFHNPFK